MPTIKVIPGEGTKKLKNLLKQLDSKKVAKVGWTGAAKYENGTPVAYVATIQEFGYPEGHIPPRSFMRTTIKEKKNEWEKSLSEGAQAIVDGSETLFSVLEKIGKKAAGDIRQKISEISEPLLKDATVAARLRKQANKSGGVGNLTKPLIDSGIMLNTCTSVVENE